MKQTHRLNILTAACIALALPVLAADEAPAPAKFRVVVVQGAGVVPGAEKPQHADAITHATSKKLNTYTLTDALAAKLKAVGAEVDVVAFHACTNLACLKASPDGVRPAARAVVFAGAVYNGPFPKPLSALFSKLKDVAAPQPGLVGSAIWRHLPIWPRRKSRGFASSRVYPTPEPTNRRPPTRPWFFRNFRRTQTKRRRRDSESRPFRQPSFSSRRSFPPAPVRGIDSTSK